LKLSEACSQKSGLHDKKLTSLLSLLWAFDSPLLPKEQHMSAGIEITVGEHTAKIYEITNRGKTAFQVSFYKAGERQKLTFSKLTKAKAEARIELGKVVSVNSEVQQLATPDMEALSWPGVISVGWRFPSM